MHANRPLPLNAAHKPTLLCCTNIVTLGGLWTNCEHLASGRPLAYAWQSLGNRLAIAWQYYGNRSVFLAIAFLSHCGHTKMYAFLIGRLIGDPAQVPFFIILKKLTCASQLRKSRRTQDRAPHAYPARRTTALEFYRAPLAKIFKKPPRGQAAPGQI